MNGARPSDNVPLGSPRFDPSGGTVGPLVTGKEREHLAEEDYES